MGTIGVPGSPGTQGDPGNKGEKGERGVEDALSGPNGMLLLCLAFLSRLIHSSFAAINLGSGSSGTLKYFNVVCQGPCINLDIRLSMSSGDPDLFLMFGGANIASSVNGSGITDRITRHGSPDAEGFV